MMKSVEATLTCFCLRGVLCACLKEHLFVKKSWEMSDKHEVMWWEKEKKKREIISSHIAYELGDKTTYIFN